MGRIVEFLYQYRCYFVFWCYLILSVFGNRAAAQRTNVMRSSDFGQHNQVFLDDSLWYFQPGELRGGNRSAITTSGWDTLHHTVFGSRHAPKGWRGMGWFGLWLSADTGLVNKKLFI